MTLVFLQYPPISILFVIAAFLTLAAARISQHALIPAFLGGITVISMLLCGLFYSVPLTELLALLLALVLLCSSAFRKEDET